MAEEVKTEEKVNPFKAEADKFNAEQKGVGLRMFTGFTRGRSTTAIKWNQFDTDKPDTLPKNVKEFSEVTGVTEGKDLLNFMIDGFNEYQYRQASDPIAEYVNPAWDDEMKTKFRAVVRGYSSTTETSIEDTVALMKPGIEAAFQKKLAANTAE